MPYILTRGAYDEHTQARLDLMRDGQAGMPLLHTQLTCGDCQHFKRISGGWGECVLSREQLRCDPEPLFRRAPACARFASVDGD